MNITAKQKLVLDAINEHPESANNDALLFSLIWIKEGWDFTHGTLYQNLSRVTRPETITRRRRELFNLGLIEYSTSAQKARMEAMKAEQEAHTQVWHNFLGMNPEEELAKLTIRRTADDDHTAVSWLND